MRGKPLASPCDVEDWTRAWLELPSGAAATLTCSWNLHAGCDAVIELELYGTGGGVALRNVDGSFFDFRVEHRRGTSVTTIAQAMGAEPDAWGPLVFEDGRQRRDFVSVHDVARACVLAYESSGIAGRTFNVGSGQPMDVLEVARAMARILGREIGPEVLGKVRVGDIRHCFADVTAAAQGLGYEPRVSFEEGLRELAEWLGGQAAEDRYRMPAASSKLVA